MASLNYNKVMICGRLCADPDQRHTQTGTAVTTFRVAVNRKSTNDPDQPKADFFSVVAWKNTAEFVSRYFAKGASIFVEGRLQERQWTDQQGNKRNVVEIIAEDVRFVDSKSDTPTSNTQTNNAEFEDISSNDDLPF